MTEPLVPSRLDRSTFLDRFGGIYEHAGWVAEAVWERVRAGALDDPEALAAAMAAAVDAAPRERRLALIRAHPDLAGRAAEAGALTAASKAEQTGAGLDRLTPEQRAAFRTLNQEYKARFGFPFIIAVAGRGPDEILAAFRQRIAHEPEVEFASALAEIHKIARGRLAKLFGEARP
ncbi:MAG: 2-oxo-4-hydroxy-4-carboxy-5-ureidoimidazoline decarboxylase [Rhodothalassiaceae bacterium]